VRSRERLKGNTEEKKGGRKPAIGCCNNEERGEENKEGEQGFKGVIAGKEEKERRDSREEKASEKKTITTQRNKTRKRDSGSTPSQNVCSKWSTERV